MRLIGLCGRSGSGKSTFSKIALELGIKTIDCDAVYKEMVSRPSPCLEELRVAFGDEIINQGALNRRILAPIVFSDKSKLNLLNTITHKHITQEIERIISNYKEEEIILLDAPTLFESGLDNKCQCVVAVVCSDEVSIQRIIQRDGISKEDAVLRLANQKPLEFYYKNCHIVIENNSTEEEFKYNSINVINKLKEDKL